MNTTEKILLFFILIASQNLFAQEIVTDRPDQTESSVTVEKKNFQIESGALYFVDSEESINKFIAPSILIRYGITNSIELRMALHYETTKVSLIGLNEKYSGFNDLEFGIKFQVLNKIDQNIKIAFLTHFLIPTATKELTTNSTGFINKLAISHNLTSKIGLGYNIGYSFVEKENSLTYSLALGYSISNTIGVYIEPYGSWAEQGQFETNFNTGFTFLINPNFQLDVSYGTGLNNKMNYFSTGFSWKIDNFLTKKNS